MHEVTSLECSRIAQDLQIRKVQVEAVVQLLAEGNTVPFITRYRKERTGGLNEEVIRQIQKRVQILQQLHDRKQTILKTIDSQGKLTPELRDAISKADTTRRLEDLYLPYKPKKKSLAAAAKEKGLEPLAWAIWTSDAAVGNLDELVPSLVDAEKGLASADDVRAGLQHIVAEYIAEAVEIRAPIRQLMWESGKITSAKSEKAPEGHHGNEFKDYFQFNEGVRIIPPHRILALNRGERENFLKIKYEWPTERIVQETLKNVADLMLARVGAPLLASAPKSAAPVPSADSAPQASQETPPAETPPTDTGAAPPSPESAPEASPSETAPTDASPAETPPAPSGQEPSSSEPAPTSEAPNTSESAPLVAGLTPSSPPPELTGDLLSPSSGFKSPHVAFLKLAMEDALNRLVIPSLEREIRSELTDDAELHAVSVFGRNLRSLLLQPPLHGKRVLAIDPGYRTGCKAAALDEFGNLVDQIVVYPFGPAPGKRKREERKGDAKSEGGKADAAKPESVTEPQSFSEPVAASETPTTETAHGESPATPSVTETAPPLESGPTAEAPPASTDAPVASEASPPESASESLTEASANVGGEKPTATEPPAPPVDRKAESRRTLAELVAKHGLQVVALGNGSGCRETEEIVSDLIQHECPNLAYVIVSEAGASVYSVSPVAREEFPDFDATLRSAISIGRRLQDPLSELVKIDPQSIGVGLYQHDVGKKDLKDTLEGVVESCVNQVGVDVNTASVPLLRYVAGMNQLVSRELVEYRRANGPFTHRDQLLQVPNMGPLRYQQSAGFLKIPNAENVFDRTWIHPESYEVASNVLAEIGYSPASLDDKSIQGELHTKLKALNIEELAKKLGVGSPTLHDILESLLKPGRDPREELPPPVFKKGVMKLEDVQPGMELKGTVQNVVDFGAFVDIGLKEAGLVHISQMANRYIKSPYDVVSVNDVVAVWVLSIDKDRGRVSLTMIQPGSERKPPERRRPPQQGERSSEPRPMGDRPPQRDRPPQQGDRPPQDRGRPPHGRGGPRPGGEGRGPQGAGVGQGGDRGRAPQGRGGPPRGGPGGPGGRFQGGGRPGQGRDSGARPSTPPNQAEAQRTMSAPSSMPPRKPRRDTPKPNLSQAAKEGKEPLRTFSELSAFFSSKKEPDSPKTPTPDASVPPEVKHEPAPESPSNEAAAEKPAETPPGEANPS